MKRRVCLTNRLSPISRSILCFTKCFFAKWERFEVGYIFGIRFLWSKRNRGVLNKQSKKVLPKMHPREG